MVSLFTDIAGSWKGHNGFRLMPDDDLFDAPTTAAATLTARGSVLSLCYDWQHPDNGQQEGTLVIARTADNAACGLWLDTWHQKSAQPLADVEHTDESIMFEFEYAEGWRWQIEVGIAEELLVTMRNIVPREPVTPYEAMIMRLERA
jgi:hypothetical protein